MESLEGEENHHSVDDTNEENRDHPPSKKLKTSNNNNGEEELKKTTTVGEKEKEKEKDKEGEEEEGSSKTGQQTEEPHCLVCMETDSADSQLQRHQCGQCAGDAWMVCVCCNEALLSRTCPVCRGDYAPIVMYPMPGLPLKKLADPTITTDERAKLLYKFGVVRQLISRTNVSVWTPSDQKMHFTLPQKVSDNSDEISVTIVSIPYDISQLGEDGRFLFTNAVWDEIENVVEAGEVQAGDMVDVAKGCQWLLSFTKEDGHKVFTMMAPSDWAYMLDPGESPDVSDALRAIRDSIVSSINFPSNGKETQTVDDNTENEEKEN